MEKSFRNERPEMMKSILTVREKQYVSPNYIRIILEGDMRIYSKARLGDNNKVVIPAEKSGEIVLPDFGGERRGQEKNAHMQRPIVRTYTLRALDFKNNLMTIDFVAHGENGPASSWAIHAEPGDKLGVLMKAKNKHLFVLSDYHLLVGDHTALPVISVILEHLTEDAKGKAILEVASEADKIELKKPAQVEIEWLINATPGKDSKLAAHLKATHLSPDESNYVFAAAEQQTVQEIQEFLRNESHLKRHHWQAMSYWKYGQAEDISSDERRELSHKF